MLLASARRAVRIVILNPAKFAGGSVYQITTNAPDAFMETKLLF